MTDERGYIDVAHKGVLFRHYGRDEWVMRETDKPQQEFVSVNGIYVPAKVLSAVVNHPSFERAK